MECCEPNFGGKDENVGTSTGAVMACSGSTDSGECRQMYYELSLASIDAKCSSSCPWKSKATRK